LRLEIFRNNMENSGSIGTINHEGIVQKADDNVAIVSITAASVCSGCHAEGTCTLSGKEEKIIEVSGKYNVKPGDKVIVIMKQSMGYTALLYGYILPLISVIIILIILISNNVPELFSGLISLAVLIPYYIVLFIFRKGINKKFTFTLKV
jgi:sigma-E factor negative regulatory protein RseC